MWYQESKKPKLLKDHGWMKESVPVVCEVEFEHEFDLGLNLLETRKCFCVCSYLVFKDSDSKWSPITDHLEAQTMPSADYNINVRDKFKVLKWSYIES